MIENTLLAAAATAAATTTTEPVSAVASPALDTKPATEANLHESSMATSEHDNPVAEATYASTGLAYLGLAGLLVRRQRSLAQPGATFICG